MDASVTLRFPSLTIQDDPRSTATVADKEVPAQAETSDESLMREVSEGSREALGLLFHRYARIVRGVAYRVLRDASEADDLLQDIFFLIDRKCGMFDAPRGPARFWILQMTSHRAIARRRYLNSRHFYTSVDIEDAEN